MTINKLDTRGWWAVDGEPIYVPSLNTKIEHSNITGASTGRSEDGIMRIDWVRRDVRKVFLRYAVMTKAELSAMMDLLQGKEFVFTFRDQGTTQTMNAYVGESKYKSYNYSEAYDGDEIYTDVEINVIEL
jgi:hypothetical protein